MTLEKATDEVRQKSNQELTKCRADLDQTKQAQLKLREESERAKREKRTVEGKTSYIF